MVSLDSVPLEPRLTRGPAAPSADFLSDASVIRVQSLGSGSSGNAFLILSQHGRVLVDCGIGVRSLANGLRAANVRLADLDAVLLTHEHSDHIRSLPSLIANGLPVLCTSGTARAAGIPPHLMWDTPANREHQVGQISVRKIRVSHDAAEPCGFHLTVDSLRISLFTDIGQGSPEVAESIRDSDLIVIEANHDEDMLRSGPYPSYLKRRIRSASGHLSNQACGRLLATSLASSGTSRTIWLAHLSETNNRSDVAVHTVAAHLQHEDVIHRIDALPRGRSHHRWPLAVGQLSSRQLRIDCL